MIRTYKYRLYPTRRQSREFDKVLDQCRFLYNASLQERKDAWVKTGISISKFDQFKSLTIIREENEDFGLVSIQAQRSVLVRLDLAFKSFFRRCKRGEKPGYPRFKSKDRFDSFGVGRALPDLESSRVRIPNLGCVKLGLHRPLQGEVRNTTIKLECGKWYVLFQCALGKAPEKRSVSKAVGIDLGLTNFLVTSDGAKVSNPKYFKRGEELLAQRQRRLSTKKKSSRNRAKSKLLVQKAHRHIYNQRRDFFWKLSRQLAQTYDLIAHEDLEIQKLINKDDNKRAKSITDTSWSKFLHTLSCKAEEAGVTVVKIDPRGTSQRCSSCAIVVKKTLYERTHSCPECGLVLDRDHNAALNVLRLGRSLVGR